MKLHRKAEKGDGMIRRCVKCGQEKPKSEFGKQGGKRNDLFTACKECRRKQNAEWRAKNGDRHRANAAAWRAANPERAKAADAAWRAANPDRIKKNCAAWLAANPERRRVLNRNRKDRIRGSGGKLSNDIADKLFRLQRGKCACGCGEPLGDDYHLDHRMPLALGGTNTDDNIQLLRPTCNIKKGAKHPVDFMQSKGFLL